MTGKVTICKLFGVTGLSVSGLMEPQPAMIPFPVVGSSPWGGNLTGATTLLKRRGLESLKSAMSFVWISSLKYKSHEYEK